MMTTTDFTYSSIYSYGKEVLLGEKIDDSEFDAMELLLFAFNISREHYVLNRTKAIATSEVNKYLELIDRRKKGEPLQYILGKWEFYGLDFKVGKGVLIPRPETEMLVAYSLEYIKDKPKPRVLDLCSGSGCIPIAIAKSYPLASVYGVEISDIAYNYFIENIELNSTSNVTPIHCDIFELNIDSEKFDVITSNPPYIKTSVIPSLQRELEFEPALALDGGDDGLIFYRYIASLAPKMLKKDGMFAVEIGEEQGEDVKNLFIQNSFSDISIEKDFNGLDRVVKGYYRID